MDETKNSPLRWAYFQDRFTGRIVHGIVENEIERANGDVVVKFHGGYYVRKDGKQDVTMPYNGIVTILKEMVWSSYSDAVEGIRKQEEVLYEKYCSEINDLTRLLEFPLKHCLNGDINGNAYIDHVAKRAYIAKAKEIFGVTIEDD